MHSTIVDLAECPNCGTPLHAAFCATCGQKAAPLNPSFGEFLHDPVHELAHVDGKIAPVLLARIATVRYDSIVSNVALTYGVVYFVVAMRRAYDLSWTGAVMRAIVVQAFYIVAVAVAAVLAAIIAPVIFHK